MSTRFKQCVMEFIHTFKATLDPRVQIRFVKEETAELNHELDSEGTAEASLKELVDVLYVVEGFHILTENRCGLLRWLAGDEWDNWTRAIEKANSAACRAMDVHGFRTETVLEAFLRVHASNMSKLDRHGNVLYRKDGKVKKGPLYKAPDLSDLV